MRLIALDDLWMDDLNLPERPLLTDRSDRLGFATRRREGLNGSHFVRVVPETARWVVLFKCDDDASRNAILAALGGDVTEERRLLAERDDIASTLVVAYGVPVKIAEPNQFDLVVEFEGMDSVWVDASATETTKSFTSPLDRALHLDVPGNTRMAPKIILTPQTQRTASAGANAGWKFRRRCTITNNGDVPWFREPCRISLGDTTALTPTKAQADGDDVRLWLDGMEIARSLVTWDTAASFIWFIIPALLPGASMVVDIVYGNESAVSPPTLAYPDLPPFFLTTSSNAVWTYPADEDAVGHSGLGIWHLSGDVEPITPDYGVPGAWRPVRTVKNPDSTEIGYQLPYDGNGAIDALARFHAFAEKEPPAGADTGPLNDYNGVAFYSPLPITKLRAGFVYNNQDASWDIGILYRNSSAEDWARLNVDIATDETGGTITVAPADYTLLSPSYHLAVVTQPENEWEANAVYGDGLTARTDEEWIVTRDASDMAIVLGAEEEIYELATELRLGGGEDFTPPYRALLVGNARGESGAGTPRAAVTLSQALVIDTADYTHEVFNDALTAKVENAPAHAVSGVVGWDDDGEADESPTNDWLPLAPTRTVVPNGDFQVDIGGWMVGTSPSDGSATRSWDGVVGGEQAGSYKFALSGITATQEIETWSAKRFLVNGRESVSVAAWMQSASTALRPRLGLRFLDDDEALLSAVSANLWIPAASVAYRRNFSAAVPYGATRYQIVLIVRVTSSAITGNVWFDDITINDNDLIITDATMGGGGALDVTVQTRGRWL